ncbi:tetratricopeptide repeat protein [uncultured Methanobrevibacter sp.]|uniref:tetratricopeptide repeat protein n=1 Tax=uncultured Methanobrevibacter sp. TaxID=253161 RepID=UPI002633941A|nr:tetratricopeptide repeat protein [uncultured Methanobrevibacter sp.]
MLEEYIESRISEAYDYLQNDTEKALRIFDEILEIEPDNIEALNGKGSSLMKLNRLDEADKYYNHSLSICENSSALLNKGIIFKRKRDFENALIFYDKASQINPDLESIVDILKNELIYANNKRDMSDYSYEANKMIVQGIEFKKEDKLLDAMDAFKKAIECDMRCEDEVNGMIDEIKCIITNEFIYDDRQFDAESKIDRLKMQALRALTEENYPDKALRLMDLVLRLDETDIDMVNHKGGALFICNEYENAIECFDKCISMDKNYSYAIFNKALVLRTMNKLPEALECFDEVLKIPENHNKVKAYRLEILKKIHEDAKTD